MDGDDIEITSIHGTGDTIAPGHYYKVEGTYTLASRDQASLGDSTVTAQVGIGPDGDAFGLIVTLVIPVPGMEREKVREFAEAAHLVCPYSRATRGNISVELRVL